jgi:hypothetical protein
MWHLPEQPVPMLQVLAHSSKRTRFRSFPSYISGRSEIAGPFLSEEIRDCFVRHETVCETVAMAGLVWPGHSWLNFIYLWKPFLPNSQRNTRQLWQVGISCCSLQCRRRQDRSNHCYFQSHAPDQKPKRNQRLRHCQENARVEVGHGPDSRVV